MRSQLSLIIVQRQNSEANSERNSFDLNFILNRHVVVNPVLKRVIPVTVTEYFWKFDWSCLALISTLPTICWTFLFIVAEFFIDNCYYSLRFRYLLNFSVVK